MGDFMRYSCEDDDLSGIDLKVLELEVLRRKAQRANLWGLDVGKDQCVSCAVTKDKSLRVCLNGRDAVVLNHDQYHELQALMDMCRY
jgi:hypothetical protein